MRCSSGHLVDVLVMTHHNMSEAMFPCAAPLDTWSSPDWGLAYVLLVETEVVVIFLDYAFRTSLGTFSILLTHGVHMYLLDLNPGV